MEKLAQACREYGIRVEEILGSGKLRAEQSAEILSDALGAPHRSISGIAPGDPVAPFAAEIESWREERIVVGHLPFLDRLAALLTAGREEPSVVAFRRGGMVCLEKRERNWCILWTAGGH